MNRAYFNGLKVVANQDGRVYALFFDGTGNDNIQRPLQTNLRDRQFRLVCTFPSVTGSDQQIFDLGERAATTDRFSATYYSTVNGTADFVVGIDIPLSTSTAWSIQNSGFSVGNVNTVICDVDSNLAISEASINGVLLTNPANAGSRYQGGSINSYRLGTRPNGDFPYKGVIIEWRDGDDVFNDENNWGDFTITGAKRCYTDNFDDAVPTWRLDSDDSIITL